MKNVLSNIGEIKMTKYYEKKITEFDLNPDISLKHEINSIETGSEVDFSDFINFFDNNKDKKIKKAKASLDINFSELIYNAIKESKLDKKFIYDLRFWQWICLNPLNEYCIWRWDVDIESTEPEKTVRFLGGGGVTGFSRNSISRLYIPAEMLINEANVKDLKDGNNLFESFWDNQQKELSICQSILSMNKDIFIAAVRCADGLNTNEIKSMMVELNFRSSSYYLDVMNHEEIFKLSNS